MLDSAIQVNQFLVGYARMLLGDIAEERMTEQPLPGVNHPAWVLGHLTLTTDGALAALGAQKVLPEEWRPLFKGGSTPSAAHGTYPSKDELLRAFEQGYERVRQRAASATAADLARPNPNERVRERLPTVKDLVAFLLTGHVGVHLGQLSAWRRMIGLPPMF
jgi:hypothetical protein